MTKKNCSIVVLISGSGTNLQALINASTALRYEIKTVISNTAGAFGLKRAEHHNIPTKIIEHQSYDSRQEFDQTLSTAIEKINPDLIVLAGFMRILGVGFVKIFQGRILNIHPSLLPKYPGMNTHKKVLDAGDDIHGTTIHFVTEDLDGGPIIAQESIPVLHNDTVETLTAKILAKEHTLYPLVVSWFAHGRLTMKNGKALLDNEILPPTGAMINL